jgi:hypothetical protein
MVIYHFMGPQARMVLETMVLTDKPTGVATQAVQRGTRPDDRCRDGIKGKGRLAGVVASGDYVVDGGCCERCIHPKLVWASRLGQRIPDELSM